MMQYSTCYDDDDYGTDEDNQGAHECHNCTTTKE